jgi:hypothetical protein
MNTNKQEKDDGLSHFNGRVSKDIAAKIQTVAKLAKDELIGDIGRGECYACDDISPIYGYDPGGFIPFRDGGFMVTELYRHDIDSSYHLTEGQSLKAQEHEKYMYECFYSDNREALEAAGIDPEAFSYDDVPEDLKSDFEAYESEWWEPALLRFCIFINKPEGDIWGKSKDKALTIELSLSLNYSDSPYYREKHDDDTLATLALTIEEFMNLEPEHILSGFKERIKFD